MRVRQWVGEGTDLKHMSLQTKAACAGVCLSGSARLCRASSNIPTLNTRQGQSENTDIPNCLLC